MRGGNDQARLIENHGPRRRAVPSPHRVTCLVVQNSTKSHILWKTSARRSRPVAVIGAGAERPQEPPLCADQEMGDARPEARHTGHPRARHGDAENRLLDGLTVPKHPRALRLVS